MIWQKEFTIEQLNQTKDNLVKHIGIEFTEFGDNYLMAKMPVDKRTHQPFGLLHGGASVVLAESLGSLAGYLCLANSNQITVGQEINANHLKSVKSGWVFGKAEPIHLGKRSQVWNIIITDEKEQLIAVSRLTLAVI